MKWLGMTMAALVALAGCEAKPSSQEVLISKAKNAASEGLRDPSSAQFRKLRAGTDVVCGEINGKNGFGAYAGFKPFIYSNGLAEISPETVDWNSEIELEKIGRLYSRFKDECPPE